MAHSKTRPIANLSCRPTDVDEFMALADAVAKRKRQRFTPIRRRVLKLLAESKAPTKAYDLLKNLDGTGASKPPTVYRALDFLLELGLAHKIETLNAYVACGHADHMHKAAFLICDSCLNVEELHAAETAGVLKTETDSVGFVLGRSVIEAHGQCAECAR
ncbi:MAG: transcriptional repressor [Hyphomonadaceae bacterium]|nr:transcriptional repressor [Hyphomonadaceae bacterium]OUX95928.1 MAG: transcriptional repressor [Hyphomonas sp. TMED17]CAI8330478.1 MAG: Zinc uptake regulation protein [Hyphomonas sp. TMED17]